MPSIIPQPRLDFSDRDFDANKLRLQGLLRSVFPDWTEYNIASAGNMIVELFADLGDGLHFYNDAAARNAFWPTVTERIQAIRIGRIFDFQLTSAAAATVDCTLGLPAATTQGVTIPAATRVRSKDPENSLEFRTVLEATIPIGQRSVTGVSVENATPQSDLATSNGAPNQEFLMAKVPYLDSSASATAVDGTYTEATSFLGLGPDDKKFVVFVDQFNKARMRFGNGSNGSIPQGSLTISYKTGGGAAGNVDAGQIRIVDDTVIDGGGSVAPLSITNPLKASGGLDRQTVAQARAQAPAGLRTLTRSVTSDDFENGALSVAGVARALMATSNESSAIQENTGILYVVASGAELASGRTEIGTPSSALLADVLTAVTVTKPPTLTFVPTVAAATFTTVNVSTRIFLSLGSDSTTVAEAINAAVKDLFAVLVADGTINTDIDFGAKIKDKDGTIVAELAWSDVFNAIRDTAGVRAVDPGPVGLLLNSSRASVAIGSLNFPQLGTVTVIDADTGSTLLSE